MIAFDSKEEFKSAKRDTYLAPLLRLATQYSNGSGRAPEVIVKSRSRAPAAWHPVILLGYSNAGGIHQHLSRTVFYKSIFLLMKSMMFISFMPSFPPGRGSIVNI